MPSMPRESITNQQQKTLRDWYFAQSIKPSKKACIAWFESQFGHRISQSTVSEWLGDHFKHLDAAQTSQASPDVYQYEPLSTPTAMRILVLHPAKNFYRPIQYGLVEKDLSNIDCREVGANYEAISYVWGTQKRARETFCDGKLLYVTPNCEIILRHLRLRNKVRTLWIDAICIDQGPDKHSLNEKNSQVLRMNRVYECASTVLVWFGVAHKDSIMVLEYLQKIGQLFPEGCHLPWNVDNISQFAKAREQAYPLARELKNLIGKYILSLKYSVISG
jgi:hypothetical protein